MFKFIIAKWDSCMKTAYASTWDDFCIESWRKLVEYANNKGILLTFYINAGYVESGKFNTIPTNSKMSIKDIQFFKQIIQKGNEIGGHTMNHIDMSTMSNEDIEKDCIEWINLMKYNNLIQKNQGLTFSYPFGKKPKSLDIIKKYFIGARSITTGLNNFDPKNIYRLKSINLGKRTKLEKLNKLIEESIENEQILIESGHGVSEEGVKEGWSPIPLDIICKHYDYISKKKEIWKTTIANIVKYIEQRNHIELIHYNNVITFKFNKKLEFDLIPLTIIIPKEIKSVRQNKKNISILNNYIKTKDFINPIFYSYF